MWAKPVTEIAKELGISDVRFGENLYMAQRSRPPRGYWQKLGFGKALTVPGCRPLVKSILSRFHNALSKAGVTTPRIRSCKNALGSRVFQRTMSMCHEILPRRAIDRLPEPASELLEGSKVDKSGRIAQWRPEGATYLA